MSCLPSSNPSILSANSLEHLIHLQGNCQPARSSTLKVTSKYYNPFLYKIEQTKEKGIWVLKCENDD